MPELSRQQSRVAALVSRGKPNKQIAFELGISEGTVKQYVSAALRRLGLDNRVQLALWAKSPAGTP